MTAATTTPTRLLGATFVRLWIVGGIANAMLWLEVLAASVYTLDVTGSGWAVALVSAARALPLLGIGALVGVLSDAWDRKRIVFFGLLLSALAAATVGLLGAVGWVKPWHIGVAALVSGLVYSTEMPARRRMIAESAGPAGTDAAVAADSLTNYATRCLGPLLGGLAYASLGLPGAFLISAVSNVVAALIVREVGLDQDIRRLDWRGVGRDLRAGLAFAASRPRLMGLLAVTLTMNTFGYSYATLIAPMAKLSFGLGAGLTGVLAAAEPAGAFLGGLVLMRLVLPGQRLAWLMGGVAILTLALLTSALLGRVGVGPALVCIMLAIGGVGSAIYTVTQTTIVMMDTPPALRSRVMGLVAMCIGSWPIGMLLAGALVSAFVPLDALALLSVGGLGVLGVIAFAAILRSRRA